MKLHFMGKYDQDPASLPRGEHKEGAVKFKEIDDSAQFGKVMNIAAIVIMVVLAGLAVFICRSDLFTISLCFQVPLGCFAALLALFPHELLHAICFKEDAYIYTNFAQGMLFVVGPEDMSKSRFIFLGLLPNIILGLVPYVIGLIFSQPFLIVFGLTGISAGAGDYYNVLNAIRQMPRGSRTYIHGLNSYWYMPK